MPGMKSKKIVVLSTTQKLGKDHDVTTKIPVIIKAYAVDDKQNIVVKRKTIFAYPPLVEVQ
jgi:hypothetical protein